MRAQSIIASTALAAAVIAAAGAVGPAMINLAPRPARAQEPAGASDGPAIAPEQPERPARTELVRIAATPAQVREVLRYCREAGPEQSAVLRAAAIDSPDPLVAGSAARALGRVGALTGSADAARLLGDSRVRVRQEAVIGLGLSRDPAALEELEQLLGCGDPDVGPLVIQAIGRIGGARARDVLESKLRDECGTEVERVFLAEALRDVDRAEPGSPGR